MRYLLNPRYRLRGWNLLPFGVFDAATRKTDFYRREQFLLLSRCDGIQEIEMDNLSEEQRAWITAMEKAGVISESDPGAMLLPQQRWHRYPCRYKRDVHWSITGKCNYRNVEGENKFNPADCDTVMF